ncbi:MAG: hypothetical protein R3F20_08020 [Planctomycetota bacterium]
MRRSALDTAVWFLFLAFVAAGLVVFFRGPREEPPPPPPLGVRHIEASRDLEDLRAGEPFSLEVEIDRPLYVSVWLLGELGPRRLFPPLALPPDMPWPLEPEDGETLRIPPGDGALRIEGEGEGRLVVLVRDDGLPEPRPELLEAGDLDARLREFGQHFLRVRTRR